MSNVATSQRGNNSRTRGHERGVSHARPAELSSSAAAGVSPLAATCLAMSRLAVLSRFILSLVDSS